MVIFQQGFYKMVLATKVLASGWVRPMRETRYCLQGRCQPWGRDLSPCISTGHHVLTGIPAAAHEIFGFLTKMHLLAQPSLPLFSGTGSGTELQRSCGSFLAVGPRSVKLAYQPGPISICHLWASQSETCHLPSFLREGLMESRLTSDLLCTLR